MIISVDVADDTFPIKPEVASFVLKTLENEPVVRWGQDIESNKEMYNKRIV